MRLRVNAETREPEKEPIDSESGKPCGMFAKGVAGMELAGDMEFSRPGELLGTAEQREWTPPASWGRGGWGHG